MRATSWGIGPVLVFQLEYLTTLTVLVLGSLHCRTIIKLFVYKLVHIRFMD